MFIYTQMASYPISNLGDITFTSARPSTSTNNYIAVPTPTGTSGEAFLTTHVTQTVSNKTLDSSNKLGTNQLLSADSHLITFPAATSTLATTNTEQTITAAKEFSSTTEFTGVATLHDPVIMRTEGSNSNSIGIPTSGTLATVGNEETFTNKTLTTPVIASLYQATGGGLISLPTTSTPVTLATTANLNADSTELKTVLNNLLEYLRNWISVGNLSMSDVRSTVDPDNLLDYTPAANQGQ